MVAPGLPFLIYGFCSYVYGLPDGGFYYGERVNRWYDVDTREEWVSDGGRMVFVKNFNYL